jgi:3,4-dihydroxy 2-butanone 4-phosphate synthase/GTP cyclohydrolase II
MGDISPEDPVLVRMHSECQTGDIFSSVRCDCQDQLHGAMRQIAEVGKGVIVYLRQEGRGIGLKHKLMAYNLQDQGRDTVQANEDLGFAPDLRKYGIGAQILCDVGVKNIKLLTNNQRKIIALKGYGLDVTERVPLILTRAENEFYMQTKKEKMGHLL